MLIRMEKPTASPHCCMKLVSSPLKFLQMAGWHFPTLELGCQVTDFSLWYHSPFCTLASQKQDDKSISHLLNGPFGLKSHSRSLHGNSYFEWWSFAVNEFCHYSAAALNHRNSCSKVRLTKRVPFLVGIYIGEELYLAVVPPGPQHY